MRQVLAAGVRWGYLSVNAAGADAVRMPTAPPKVIRPFQSWEEVDAVAAEAGRFGALVRFACATGLRPQEWQALQWRDLDHLGRTVRIERAVQDGRIAASGKTDGSLRTVVLQQRALDALGSLPRPIDGQAPVFPSPDGASSTCRTSAAASGSPPWTLRGSTAVRSMRCGIASPRSPSQRAHPWSGSVDNSATLTRG